MAERYWLVKALDEKSQERADRWYGDNYLPRKYHYKKEAITKQDVMQKLLGINSILERKE